METKVAIRSLSRVLANTYVLMLKTQNAHWNVVGAEFYSVHMMTEGQYSELFGAVDEIAERIRALGGVAPGTLKEFSSLAQLEEGLIDFESSSVALELANSNKKMAELIRKEIDLVDEADEDGTEDLLVGRLQLHEKSAWMWSAMAGSGRAQGGAKLVSGSEKIVAAAVKTNPPVEKLAAKPAVKVKKSKSDSAKPASSKSTGVKSAGKSKKADVAVKPAKKSGRLSPKVSSTG